MRIGVLSQNQSVFPTSELLKELKSRQNCKGIYLATRLVRPEIRSGGFSSIFLGRSLDYFHCIIPRLGYSISEFGFVLLLHLEKMGIPLTLSSQAFLNARNKFLCYLSLVSKNVPVPRSIVIMNAFQLEDSLRSFKLPIVIKTPLSTSGIGSVRANSYQTAKEIVEALLSAGNHTVLLQEYLRSPRGRSGRSKKPNRRFHEDIRILVVDGEIIGSMKRRAKGHEWRANFALGSQVMPYKPSIEEQELALRATEATGLEIAGVDIFPEINCIIEINVCPGWKALQSCNPDVNITKKIVDFAIRKART